MENERLEEENYLKKIVSNIAAYKMYALNTLDQKTREWSMLSPEHKSFCTKYESKLDQMKICIQENSKFLSNILPFELIEFSGSFKPSPGEMDKVRSTIRQFVRDWSAEVLDISIEL